MEIIVKCYDLFIKEYKQVYIEKSLPEKETEYVLDDNFESLCNTLGLKSRVIGFNIYEIVDNIDECEKYILQYEALTPILQGISYIKLEKYILRVYPDKEIDYNG